MFHGGGGTARGAMRETGWAQKGDKEGFLAVDRRRLYATGFSNGASMAFRVGSELSARFAAIAPFAGALWIKVA